jgi:hypothetical protein
MMRQIIIYSGNTLKKKGASKDKIQQYNKNPKLRTTQNDKEFLSDKTLQYSELSGLCEHKTIEKERNIQRLYCTIAQNGTEKMKCNLKNCPKI